MTSRAALPCIAAAALALMAFATGAEAASDPASVFRAYETAVQAGDMAAVDALIAPDAKAAPFYDCAPGVVGRACLIEYLRNTVVTQHTRFSTLATRTDGAVVEVRLQVSNDLTRRFGVERFQGVDRILVRNGKIVEFAFIRDLADAQTVRFFEAVTGPRR